MFECRSCRRSSQAHVVELVKRYGLNAVMRKAEGPLQIFLFCWPAQSLRFLVYV